MDILYAVVLGVIQGLTEFLPVSSSGHLVLFQNLFGLTEPELLLDICLHVGTLAAVCSVFFREIISLLRTFVQLPRLYRKHGNLADMFGKNPDIRMAGLIFFGSIPTGICGVLFHQIADRIFSSVLIVGVMLVITGTFLWMTRWLGVHGKNLQQMKLTDALIVGLAQGFSILPGISRSGATISAALFLGIDRGLAGRYSFLLCVPAITGALLLHLKSPVLYSSISPVGILAGSLAAGLTGFFALKILLRLVRKGSLFYFSPYCWILGTAVVAWHFLR